MSVLMFVYICQLCAEKTAFHVNLTMNDVSQRGFMSVRFNKS